MKFTNLLSSIIGDIRNLKSIQVMVGDVPACVASVDKVIPSKSKFPMTSTLSVFYSIDSEASQTVQDFLSSDLAEVYILDTDLGERIPIENFTLELEDNYLKLTVQAIQSWKPSYILYLDCTPKDDNGTSS